MGTGVRACVRAVMVTGAIRNQFTNSCAALLGFDQRGPEWHWA